MYKMRGVRRKKVLDLSYIREGLGGVGLVLSFTREELRGVCMLEYKERGDKNMYILIVYGQVRICNYKRGGKGACLRCIEREGSEG